METIHRKDGRLHIYVRQDKYKGELKSHNWVGRAYVNGKQKVSSSGTTNIEDAIPILEKWYDDLTQENPENIEENKQNQSKEILEPDNKAAAPQNNSSNVEDGKIAVVNSLNTTTIDVNDKEETIQSSIASTPKGITMNMLEKLKNIKFSKDSKETSDVAKSPISNKDKLKKFKDTFQNLFASKVSKLSVAGEEIAGIDISREAVRVAQVSKGKDDKWILDKFSYRLLDREKVSENILDSKDYLAEEIELAMANGAITTKNIALSIPVTSAIIRVVTSPLMTEDELKKAIETNSLWENLVQLTDNLSDYSIFHQVINRNSKNNTMEILFVASKLSDVNAFSAIVKKAGLNPVIMDVRCFSLKNAYDNSKIHLAEGKNNTAILELGVDENYLMVIHNNIPVITDIFLRPQEKQSLLEVVSDQIPAESDAVIRRYSMQIKQAIADYEGKYENKISNVQVVSSLKNIHYLI